MEEPLFFGVISDIHIDTRAPAPSVEKFRRALTMLRARSGDRLRAVLVAGDLGDRKNAEDLRIFKETYESVFSPKRVPMIHCYGDDHDFVWSDPRADEIRRENAALLGDLYFETDTEREGIPLGWRHCVVAGYSVLTLDPVMRRPILYAEQTKRRLDETLTRLEKEAPERYILVLTHPMIADTVYGSELRGGAWATEDLSAILARHPQALVFSGHLHFPLADPRSIMQQGFTAVGTGAVRYLGVETDGFSKMPAPTWVPDSLALSQGLLLELGASGDARIHRLDFEKDAEIDTPWVLPAPSRDGAHLRCYTAARGDIAHNKAPTLDDFTLEKTERGFLVRFAAGDDDEFVHHYNLSYGEPHGAWHRRRILSDFYAMPCRADMKKSYEYEVEAEAGRSYLVRLVAVDSWNAESQTVTHSIRL